MKVLANFDLTNNDHLTNLIIYPPIIQPNTLYHVIGIEDNNHRVVGDNLDNQLISSAFFEVLNYEFVNEWQTKINHKTFEFTPKIFAQHPYFWEYLHARDNENSVNYADIYTAYLAKLLGKETLCHRLEQLYLQSIYDNIQHFSFWQKQWLKHVFNVENAVEIRQFIPAFQSTINQYFENLQ